jgi:small-conductance mechanosensitive channel
VLTRTVVLLAADGQTAACGPRGDRAWLCTTVYRITGDRDAAEVADALAKPLRIVLVLVLAWLVARVLRRIVSRAAGRLRDQPRAGAFRDTTTDPEVLDDLARRRHSQRVDTLAAVLRNVVSVVVWLVAALVILSDLGVDLAPLLASAGVATIVIGFGAQQVVRDFLAGLFMLMEDQYGVGDVVDLGDATGTVEWVSLRVTRLRDVEGVVWWVPNGQVTRVGNKSQQWSRALLDVAVAPDTDIDLATDVMKRTADAMWHDPAWSARVIDEPEVLGVEDVGVTGILIRLVVTTVPSEQWNVSRELRARLKAAFDAAGVRLPVLQQRITYEMGAPPPPASGGDAATTQPGRGANDHDR